MTVSQASDPEARPDATRCMISTWFYRRIAILIVLTGGLGLYFFYDGAIGYPKKNFNADLYDVFEAGKEGRPFDADKYSPHEKKAELSQAHEAAVGGATWPGFAATRMLAEKKPKRYTEAEIREQYRFAVGLGVVSLAIIGFLLWQRRRYFQYEDEVMKTPSGEEIAFSKATLLDLKKWDRGVAILNYSSDQETISVKIDDYKYSGVGKMLEQLLRENPKVEVDGDRRWLNAGQES